MRNMLGRGWRDLMAVSLFLAFAILAGGSNICHAENVPLSVESAQAIGEKVGLWISADAEHGGTVTELLRMPESDRTIKGEHWDAYVHQHVNGPYRASAIYYDNPSKQLVSIMILIDDESQEAYMKAVLPIIANSLDAMQLTQSEMLGLIGRSMKEDVAVTFCEATQRKITLTKLRHEGKGVTMSYHIQALKK